MQEMVTSRDMIETRLPHWHIHFGHDLQIIESFVEKGLDIIGHAQIGKPD